MNIHAPPQEIRDKHPGWEYIGTRWQKGNLTWIRAHYNVTGWSWYYCFEKDIFVDQVWYQEETKENEKRGR